MASLPSVLMLGGNADDFASISDALARHFDVHIADCIQQAVDILNTEWIQVVLTEQDLGQSNGLDFLAQIKQRWPEIVQLLICDSGQRDTLLEDQRADTLFNYVSKPWDIAELHHKLRNAVEHFALARKNEQLHIELKIKPNSPVNQMAEQRALLQARYHGDAGIIRTPQSCMNQVCDMLHHVAPFDVNVVLMGESGTGKELCAKALHQNSMRRDAVFLAENCGALPDELLESELFGHRRGAFTGAVNDHVGLFEQADGGTILLDEIGEISPAFQVKLLRVLQEGEIRPLGGNSSRKVDVRVVAATNKDLEKEVAQGRFRQDLFYRLSTFIIKLPPLRERTEDIATLAYWILDDAMQQLGKKVRGFAPETLALLKAYAWPGNVRELQNEVKRMLVMAGSDYLGPSLLTAKFHLDEHGNARQMKGNSSLTDVLLEGSLKERVEVLETRIIKETLARHQWNKTRAAEELGLSRVGLRNKLERYELQEHAQKTDSLVTADQE